MSQDPTLKNVAGMLREQAEAYHDGRHAYDERAALAAAVDRLYSAPPEHIGAAHAIASLTLAREGWR